MTEYITEEEQLQRIKQLAIRYLPPIIIGIILALLFTSGWHSFQQRREKTRLQASSIFSKMLNAYEAKQQTIVAQTAAQITSKYPKTAYNMPANFLLAKTAVKNNNFSEAAKHLDLIIKQKRNNPQRNLAIIRLARIKLMQKKPQEALNLIKKINNPAFNSLKNIIKGDALLAIKKPTSAKNAYLLAEQQLPNFPEAKTFHNILQMKYNSIN